MSKSFVPDAKRKDFNNYLIRQLVNESEYYHNRSGIFVLGLPKLAQLCTRTVVKYLTQPCSLCGHTPITDEHSVAAALGSETEENNG